VFRGSGTLRTMPRALTISTDQGIVGEYVGGTAASYAQVGMLALVHPRIKRTKSPVYACDYSDELDSVDAAGHVRVPHGPGLGVPIDWGWVRAHQTDERVYD
jgi:L-alanine-DL-glutamate epimerase-like enolase superfamily enzyme